METIVQVLDCDYINVNNKTVVRIFGKDENGEAVVVFYDNYKPYFYILPKNEEEVLKELEKFSNIVESKEIVYKFLPIGFNKEKSRLIKITLNNPARVPEVRDYLNKLDCVIKTFEADILFKYRFMADFGIFGMRWIKVTGEPTNLTKIVKTNKKIIAEKIEPINVIKDVGFKYLSIDIEVASNGIPDPKKDTIIMISLAFYPSFNSNNTLILVSKHVALKDKDVIEFTDEKSMLEKLINIIDTYDPDIITGYNINNFDLPYINERLRILNLPRTLGRCNQKPINCRKLRENKYLNSIPGRIIADPYNIIKEMSKRGFFTGLKRFSLEDVAQYILGEGKVKLSRSDIPKYWNGTPEEIKTLIEYSRKDSILVLKLLLEKRLLDKYIGISMVSGVLLQDALDSGESVKVDNLLLREFNKRDFVIPNKPDEKEKHNREIERNVKELKGAFVLEPEIGLHTTSTIYLDFMSMYPSIFISYNICPTTLIINNEEIKDFIKTPYGAKFVSPDIRQGIIPSIVKNLMEERIKVKSEMKKEKNESILRSLDAKQEALKRMANAFYGYTGFLMARLYILDIANAITSCGRYYIQKTKEIVESKTKYKVIYADTDSVMIKTDTNDLDEALKIGNEMANLINEEFKGKLTIKIENIFKTFLILAKKRYVGWSFEKIDGRWEDKIVMKGIETVRRDWCNLVSEVLYNILNIILKEQNPQKALNYVKEVVHNLQENKIDLEKLVITKSISKNPEEYKGIQPHIELVKRLRKRDLASAPIVGERIGFVIIKGLQNISERAEDPEYVKKHGLKIDSKYYIENQLLPPLERVFEAIGIGKDELFRVGKQVLINEVLNNKIQNKVESILKSFNAFICDKCDKTYNYIPLIGKCVECGGEIMFLSGENKSKVLDIRNYFNHNFSAMDGK
jgi:DNA polymerase I